MDPRTLRQLWTLVETSQRGFLSGLDDNSLVEWLTHQLWRQGSSEASDPDLISGYIRSRLSLIRDLANER